MTTTTATHKTHPPPKDTDVTLTPETIALMEQRMAAAVEAGIKGAMTAEDTAAAFWGAGLKVLQKQASEHTGRFVLGGLMGLVKKVSTFLLLGGMVYALGGWTALAKLWQVFFGDGSTT